MATEEQRPLAFTPQESPRIASHTPLPAGDDFDPSTLTPRPAFLSDGTDSPRNSSLRNSYASPGTPTESGMLLANKESMISSDDDMGPTRALAEQPSRRRRSLLILIALLILVVILIAIIVPVYFTVIKPKTNSAAAGTTKAASPTSSSTPKTPTNHGPFSGGDGSTVRASNGSTFTYVNKLGGICECPYGRTKLFCARLPFISNFTYCSDCKQGTLIPPTHTTTTRIQTHGHHLLIKPGTLVPTEFMGESRRSS